MNNGISNRAVCGLAVMALAAIPLMDLAHQVADHSNHISGSEHPCDLCLQMDGNPAGLVDAGPSVAFGLNGLAASPILATVISLPAISPCGRAPPGKTTIN